MRIVNVEISLDAILNPPGNINAGWNQWNGMRDEGILSPYTIKCCIVYLTLTAQKGWENSLCLFLKKVPTDCQKDARVVQTDKSR